MTSLKKKKERETGLLSQKEKRMDNGDMEVERKEVAFGQQKPNLYNTFWPI